jgi:proline iminopeptidase
VTWLEKAIDHEHGQLVYYQRGSGPVIIFVHGGPGDTHFYLRKAAEPLTSTFRCVLYDQRGVGKSTLNMINQKTLHISRLIDDMERLRQDLRMDKVMLVGHSWGAMLAFFYAHVYPERVEKLVLISMGPLDKEMAEVAKAKLLHPLSQGEREEFDRLNLLRKHYFEVGNREEYLHVFSELMRFRLKSWFYSQEAAALFYQDYLAEGLDFQPEVAAHVNQSASQFPLWKGIERLTAPVLVIYGHQDFEPITQGYLIKERVPQAKLLFLNKCGHVPWYEQPEAFYGHVRHFLQSSSSSEG